VVGGLKVAVTARSAVMVSEQVVAVPEPIGAAVAVVAQVLLVCRHRRA